MLVTAPVLVPRRGSAHKINHELLYRQHTRHSPMGIRYEQTEVAMTPGAVLKTTANHPLLFWAILAWPSFQLAQDLIHHERYYPELMHRSGMLSVQLLILAMAITPFMRLTGGWAPIRWLAKRRRHIGVASFGYALLHTVFYLRETADPVLVWLDLSDIELAAGWVAMVVLTLLAATSNDRSLRRLGPAWKSIQRSIYIAAIAVFAHWILIDFSPDDALMWFTPLLLLQLARYAGSILNSKTRLLPKKH